MSEQPRYWHGCIAENIEVSVQLTREVCPAYVGPWEVRVLMRGVHSYVVMTGTYEVCAACYGIVERTLQIVADNLTFYEGKTEAEEEGS